MLSCICPANTYSLHQTLTLTYSLIRVHTPAYSGIYTHANTYSLQHTFTFTYSLSSLHTSNFLILLCILSHTLIHTLKYIYSLTYTHIHILSYSCKYSLILSHIRHHHTCTGSCSPRLPLSLRVEEPHRTDQSLDLRLAHSHYQKDLGLYQCLQLPLKVLLLHLLGLSPQQGAPQECDGRSRNWSPPCACVCWVDAARLPYPSPLAAFQLLVRCIAWAAGQHAPSRESTYRCTCCQRLTQWSRLPQILRSHIPSVKT